MTGRVLSNAQHELFCQCVAEGMPNTRAYREAGYKSDADKHAHRLMKRPDIIKRIDELTERASRRNDVNMTTLLDELEAERKLAMELEMPSAAIQATLGKAKLLRIGAADININNTNTVNVQGDAVLSLGDRELARRLVYLVEGGLREAADEQGVIEHDAA